MTQSFPIVPGDAKALWWIMALLFAIIALAASMLYKSMSGARNSHFDVAADGLHLHGDMYGRTIPFDQLDLDSARVVDLRQERLLMPAVRTMGTALPGYRSGWFRLNGGQKGLLYLTDPSRVAYIPTRDDYVVLLSVAAPDTLLAALRQAASR